eukprot:7743457-Karenia_brevis.AAC.1
MIPVVGGAVQADFFLAAPIEKPRKRKGRLAMSMAASKRNRCKKREYRQQKALQEDSFLLYCIDKGVGMLPTALAVPTVENSTKDWSCLFSAYPSFDSKGGRDSAGGSEERLPSSRVRLDAVRFNNTCLVTAFRKLGKK